MAAYFLQANRAELSSTLTQLWTLCATLPTGQARHAHWYKNGRSIIMEVTALLQALRPISETKLPSSTET